MILLDPGTRIVATIGLSSFFYVPINIEPFLRGVAFPAKVRCCGQRER